MSLILKIQGNSDTAGGVLFNDSQLVCGWWRGASMHMWEYTDTHTLTCGTSIHTHTGAYVYHELFWYKRFVPRNFTGEAVILYYEPHVANWFSQNVLIFIELTSVANLWLQVMDECSLNTNLGWHFIWRVRQRKNWNDEGIRWNFTRLSMMWVMFLLKHIWSFKLLEDNFLHFFVLFTM